MGGNKDYPVAGGHGYEGLKDSYIFDPATKTYTRINDMNDGHWYPSATMLGNGDVISLGGLGEDSSGTVSDRVLDATPSSGGSRSTRSTRPGRSGACTRR